MCTVNIYYVCMHVLYIYIHIYTYIHTHIQYIFWKYLHVYTVAGWMRTPTQKCWKFPRGRFINTHTHGLKRMVLGARGVKFRDECHSPGVQSDSVRTKEKQALVPPGARLQFPLVCLFSGLLWPAGNELQVRHSSRTGVVIVWSVRKRRFQDCWSGIRILATTHLYIYILTFYIIYKYKYIHNKYTQCTNIYYVNKNFYFGCY